MIYGRSGDPVTVLRLAALADVRRLDGRKPDKQDRDAIKSESYVVVKDDSGQERLYHLAFLRADEGAAEIMKALATSCNECGKPRPAGCTVTCGDSHCQERNFNRTCEKGTFKQRQRRARKRLAAEEPRS